MERKSKPRRSKANAIDAIDAMRTELVALLEVADGNAQPVARLLRLLDRVERDFRPVPEKSELWPVEAKSAEFSSRSYHVEERDGGEVLVESWLGKTEEAFRCSRDVYDAVARVVGMHSKRGINFQSLVQETRSVLGRAPAEHHVRMSLRFWLGRGILLRHKFLYFAKADREYVKAAAWAWENAAKIVRVRPR